MISSNTYSIRSIQVFLFACMLAFIMPAQAATEAASVLFSQGNVVLTNNAGSYPLEKGAAVSAGDTVITGEDGRVQMRFSDGGLVSLMPNSSFAVEEYSQPTASSEGSASVNLLKGGMRALSGSIGKKNQDSYQLKTDVATLGIRGTEFVVVMDGAAMRVHVGQGSVSLLNDFGQLLVARGQHAEVFPGQAPVLSNTAPVFVSASRPAVPSSEEQNANNQDPASANQFVVTDALRNIDPFIIGSDNEFEEDNTDIGGGTDIGGTNTGGTNTGGTNTGGSQTDPNTPPAGTYISIPVDQGFATAYVYNDAYQYLVPLFDMAQNSWSLGPDSLASEISSNSGNPPEDFLLQRNALDNANKVGDLYWSVQVLTALDQGQVEHEVFLAQVWGAAATDLPDTNLPVQAVLNYSLSGASPVYNEFGNKTLDKFDMTVNLQPNSMADITVDMKIQGLSGIIGTGYQINLITTAQNMNDENIGQFQVYLYPDSSAGSECFDCTLSVNGFLSGSGGTQAGVVYDYKDGNSSSFIGAAVLDKVP